MVTSYDDRNALSIIILDNNENILKWLDPELCEVIETSKVETCRKIELRYPIAEYELGNLDNWFNQGNKIYVPATSGINSCLYIINTEYSIDYWDKNYVKVEAEEILTELNYNFVAFITEVTSTNSTGTTTETTTESTTETTTTNLKSGEMVEITVKEETRTGTQVFKYKDTIKVTSEVLNTFFGYFYDISGLDELDSTKNVITPTGSMSYMSLLRLIEEQTERTFITDYISVDNKILRRLSLKNTANLRRVAMTETLDLNYNLNSLELNVSEENTFNAMAPEFTDNSTVVTADTASQGTTTISTDLVNKATTGVGTVGINYPVIVGDSTDTTDTTSTATAAVSTKSISEIIDEWLNYEVELRQEIPMIAQRDESGNLVTVATWYAPFRKIKGNLAIISEKQTQGNYNKISTYGDNNLTLYKTGKVSTSETVPALIYNTLANALLNKLNPVYELTVDVKDIQQLLGITNLGYNIYETLQVRIPNFDYYVPCRITETTKNLHKPGENTIKVETDVKSMQNIATTEIISNDMIINKDNSADIGGILLSEETGLANSLVTINIRLKTPYAANITADNLMTQQAVAEFKPAENTYIFGYDELIKLEKLRRNADVLTTEKNYYNVRALDGIVYKLTKDDVTTLYNAFIATYFANEYKVTNRNNLESLKNAKWDKSLSVHIYDRTTTMANVYGTNNLDNKKKYYYSYLYYLKIDTANLGETIAKQDPNYDDQIIADFRTLFTRPTIMDWQSNENTCLPSVLTSISVRAYRFVSEYEFAKLLGTTNAGTNITNLFKTLKSVVNTLQSSKRGFARTLTDFTWDLIWDGPPLTEWYPEDVTDGHRVKYSMLIFVDISKLNTVKYYNGMYMGLTGYHTLMFRGLFISNDKKYALVYDPNVPYGNPMFGNLFDLDCCIVEYEIIEQAIHLSRGPDDTLIPRTDFNNETGAMLFICGTYMRNYTENIAESTSSDLKLKIMDVDVNSKTYYFTRNNIQSTINSIYTAWINGGMKLKLETMSLYAKDTTGQLYMLNMKTLRALGYNFMLYYMGHDLTSSNLSIELSTTSNATKYLNHMGTDTDYNTPVYPQWIKYEPNFILAAACFELGYLFSYRDFFIDNTNDITFVDMLLELTTKTKLTILIREATTNNIKSVLKKQDQSSYKDTVIVVYAKDNSLVESAVYTNTVYPILLYSLDGNNVSYYNIAARGNSPVYNYDTKKTDAGKLNPYGTITLNTLQNWISLAKDESKNGGNMFILSRSLKMGSV